MLFLYTLGQQFSNSMMCHELISSSAHAISFALNDTALYSMPQLNHRSSHQFLIGGHLVDPDFSVLQIMFCAHIHGYVYKSFCGIGF